MTDKAVQAVKDLNKLTKDWDGRGSEPVNQELIDSAIKLLEIIKDEMPEPDDVYAMPDGGVIIEWHLPHDVITRFEVDRVGHAEIMTTFPSNHAEFNEKTW